MQLKLTRSQRSSMMGKTIFHLDVRASISDAEKELIRKYKFGKEIIYSSEALKQYAAGANAHMDRSIDEQGAAGFASMLKGAALGVASRFAL